MPKYKKPAQFPSPFLPGPLQVGIKDPFGATIKGLGDGITQPGPEGPPGSGVFPDLDVIRAVDGSVISAGTESMTVAGKNIVWIQLNVNNNGVAGFMLVLGSLGYSTAL